MPSNFPNIPYVGQTHTIGDITWQWNGVSWEGVAGTGPVSIVNAVVDTNGDLILYLSDSTTINAGYVIGATGPTGATGPQGPGGQSTGKVLYLNYSVTSDVFSSELGEYYKTLSETLTTVSEQTLSKLLATYNTPNSYQTTSVVNFITLEDYPHQDKIDPGVFDVTLYSNVDVDTGGRECYLFVRLYSRSSSGVETSIAQSDNSSKLTTVLTDYSFQIVIPQPVVLNTSDRLFIEVYAVHRGNSHTITMKFEGSSHYSHMHTTLLAPRYLDELADVIITSPSSNQVLKYDGTSWINGSVPLTNPAGNSTEIQFNDSGIFGSSSNLTWDNTNKYLELNNRAGLKLFESSANGTNYISFRGPDNITTNAQYIFPAGPVAQGSYLTALSTTNGLVTLAWTKILVPSAVEADTFNNLSITPTVDGATFSLANNKTLAVNNTLNFAGTDSSSINFGSGGTVAYVTNKLSSFSATTSAELANTISDETGTGLLVFNASPTFSTGLVTDSVTFNLFNTTATTINAFAQSTSIVFSSNADVNFTVGSSSTKASVVIINGTAYIEGNLIVSGYIETDTGIKGGTDVEQEYLGQGMFLDGGTFG